MGREMSFRVVSIWLVAVFTASVSAAPLSPADRDAIQQQRSEQLRREQNQRDELEHSIVLPRVAESPSAAPDSSGPCFDIRQISISDSTLITSAAQQKLLSPWLNRCLNMAQLTQLTSDVTDWDVSRGYITSRAFLTEQDISAGNLRLVPHVHFGVKNPEHGKYISNNHVSYKN